MAKSDFARTFTAIVGTLLVSTACVVGAVGPAQPGAGPAVGKAAVAVAARLVA